MKLFLLKIYSVKDLISNSEQLMGKNPKYIEQIFKSYHI